MALGDISILENGIQALLKTGAPRDGESTKAMQTRLARELAESISNYIDSISLSIPENTFIQTATGQVVVSKNLTPVEITKQ